MQGFLTEFHVAGFACLKKVEAKLTALHAFIGPNDSGKSTLLSAIAALFSDQLAGTRAFAKFKDGSDLRIVPNTPNGVQVMLPGNPQIMPYQVATGAKGAEQALSMRVLNRQARAQIVRLNADELRQPGHLIPHGTNLQLQGRGLNVAGLYDAVRDRSVDRFIAISNRVTELFPPVKQLGLRATGSNSKVLTVTLHDGTEVLSQAMSEGLLYFLAFAILSEIERPSVYLVEEPENGLHPSRIADIVKMLRAIAEDPQNPVQILMATHSPLVVNELSPEEVTVVTRDAVEGTQLRSLKDTPHFAERSKIYALGELWLSYADGKTEAALLDPEAR